MGRGRARVGLAAVGGALLAAAGCYHADVGAGARLPAPPQVKDAVFAAQKQVRATEERLDAASAGLNRAIRFRMEAARELKAARAAMTLMADDARSGDDPLAGRLRLDAARAKYDYALAAERYAKDLYEARLAERQLADARLTSVQYDEQARRTFVPPVGDAAEPWTRAQYESLPPIDSEWIRGRMRESQRQAAKKEQLSEASLAAAQARREQWMAARRRWLAARGGPSTH